ncbi:4-coumarate-CoA ligase-like protein [Zymoseptoria brevis]|uniref:4-coumarate-CoA ligase-like protein n=1 Tax=Zymoseptoria brevis TaxID=1047168 RepID=A0A0F4GE95_9PEZI|nr:4-coumarate-CoA ligase-like protein [Zymoseptoria brevis]
MSHYIGDREATRKAFSADGWLKTGDLGYIDDGKIYVVDRIKDIIKVNGFQVSPTELENALYAMEGYIREAAVISIDSHEDEHPFAFIVRKQPVLSEEQVKAHLRAQLSSYKASRVEICFVDGIPRNTSGKVERWKLRGMASLLRGKEDGASIDAAPQRVA